MIKQKKMTVSAADSQSQVAAAITKNSKTKKMKKEKKSDRPLSVFAIPAKTKTRVQKFSKKPRMSKQKIEELLTLVNIQCENSIMINGFDENIIGYDANTNAIIYDGSEMIKQLADDYIQSDIDDGIEIEERWEYYEQAVDYFEYNISGTLEYWPICENKPRPILLMRFED
jgi:hypothetical protein